MIQLCRNIFLPDCCVDRLILVVNAIKLFEKTFAFTENVL